MIEKLNSLSAVVCLLIGIGLAGLTYLNMGDGLAIKERVLKNEKKELAKQQEEVRSAQEIASDKAKFEEELNYVSDRLKAALEYLPESLNEEEILSKLYKEAASAGVTLKSVKPGETKADKFYEQISLEVELEGGFNQITLFLSYISKLKRIVRVKDFDLRVKDVVDMNPILTLRGNLVAYRYVEPKDDPNQKGAKK